jgi:YVTN family beta-propeller protein
MEEKIHMNTHMQTFKKFLVPACWLLLAVFVLASGAPAGAAKSGDASGKPAGGGGQAASPEKKSDKPEATAAADPNRITRKGLVVEHSMRPTRGGSDKLVAGEWADITFRITDAISGEPYKGSYPGAWVDLTKAWEALGDEVMECKDRVALYLQGIVGVRPMIDLTSQFLLVLNRDNSISIIDPKVGITGITNLFGQINIKQPGADWAKTEDHKRLFVSMPLADEVALVDTDTFKVAANVDAGEQPTRVELQSDERYLWVGNNAPKDEESGVTVIDADAFKWLAFIPTGKGHHEIAFSDGDRYAFVSNRDDGTVSVIDVRSLKKIKDLKTGPRPMALDFSPLGKVLYVADGETGEIAVVDNSLEIVARIRTAPGLGPLRFSQDGRWGLAVNSVDNAVFVIDAATNRVVHTIQVGNKPYQVSFTDSFAYIRSLGTGDVGLIPLSELVGTQTPPVTYIQAGPGLPGAAPEISIADSIVPSGKHAAVYVVNPAAGTLHYYMEGMVASMGAFRNYGREPRAVEIVDRSLREIEPGVYRGQARVPVEGTYDIAFMMETPRFVHCFSATAEPDPKLKAATTNAPMAIEYHIADRRVPAGGSTTVKFKLSDPVSGKPHGHLKDVTVLYYGSDGRGRRVVPARALGEGLYEADVKIKRVTTYYVFVGSRSAQLKYADLPFVSLMGTPAPVKRSGAKAGTDGKP